MPTPDILGRVWTALRPTAHSASTHMSGIAETGEAITPMKSGTPCPV